MKIKKITKQSSLRLTGDIEVENTHTYQLANGVVSHNSVLLGTSSGIHPEHSERYFRIMQLNKESDTAKWLYENMPEILEDSVWSSTSTDYVVYCPIENQSDVLFKDSLGAIEHLDLIKLVQKHWIGAGKIKERGIKPDTSHNVSCTVIIEDKKEVAKYLFENQDSFTAVSFLSNFGDKDYAQAPFTSVKNTAELIEVYGTGVVFASGLIVDGLHYFNDDLWNATKHLFNKDMIISGSRSDVLLKKDWLRRARKFAKNYFKNDYDEMIYCLKDVHLWHKWNSINKTFKLPDFATILNKPEYNDIANYASVACSGAACEIVTLN